MSPLCSLGVTQVLGRLNSPSVTGKGALTSVASLRATAAGLKATVDVWAKNMVLTAPFQDKLDCRASWTLYLCYILCLFFFSFGVLAHNSGPLGGIPYLHETSAY